MFTPFHIFRIIWDLLQAIQIGVCFYIFSLLVFFELSSLPSYYSIMLQIGFIADMFINMNTGFLDKGNVVLDRTKAMRFYFSKNFVYDLISLVPILFLNFNIYFENIIYNIIIWVLVFFKYQTLSIILQRLENFFTFQKNKKNTVDLCRLLIILLSTTHFFAALWHGLAEYQIYVLNREDTWLHKSDLIETSIIQRYVSSYYFMAVTMSSGKSKEIK